MSNKHSMIPSPEVVHLTTVFRRIQNGEIRIPAFQRGFVWEEDQIIKLLESIFKGYPIGSLLFWKVDKAGDTVLNVLDESSDSDNTLVPFPHITLTFPVNYVLDGMQRLSSLYGVFLAATTNDSFNVVFDLEKREFIYDDQRKLVAPRFLNLSDLFAPRRLLDAQRSMTEQDNGEILIDSSIELLSSFQEYMLPIVTISTDNVTEVVEIFERVNSTGTKLSRVDFMRALTWSDGFDLNVALRSIKEDILLQGFVFPYETLTKVVAILLGKSPTPTSMLELRSFSSDDLHEGVMKAKMYLSDVTGFLRNEFSIYSSDFVPYEGQLLVLVKLFEQLSYSWIDDGTAKQVISTAREWFWNTSFSETLRGKPDGYVIREIQSAVNLTKGDLRALPSKLLLDDDTLRERRFTKGKALSSAIAALFASNKARSLVTGEVIPPEKYMTDFKVENFEAICSQKAVQASTIRKVSSPKVLANLCVVLDTDRKSYNPFNPHALLLSVYERFEPETADEILRSLFVDDQTFYILKGGDEIDFLRHRSANMLMAAGRVNRDTRTS